MKRLKMLRTTKVETRRKLMAFVERELRSEEGISLATILAIGTVSSLWLTAMMAIVIPTYQKTAGLKTSTAVRAAAEAALDYTLNQMNNSISQGNPSDFDAPPQVGSTQLSTISPGTLGLSNANINIQVMVQNLGLQGPQSGQATQPMIFDPQLDQLIQQGKLANPYRLMTASATLGSITKNIRVLLVPQSVCPETGLASGNGVPTMPFAIYGVNQTAFVGSVGLNSYVGRYNGNGTFVNPPSPRPPLNDPRVRADFGSGTTVNQVGYSSAYSGMALGGTQMEFCNPIVTGTQASAAIAQMYNASAVAQAPWCNIYDNVYSNYPNAGSTSTPSRGMVYADKSTVGTPSSGYIPRGWDNTTGNASNQNAYNNVFGLSNVMGAYPFDHVSWPDANYDASTLYPAIANNNNMGGILSNAQQYAKPQIPPVPTSPNTAPRLGNINLTGSAMIQIRPGVPAPTAPIGSRSSGVVLLPPGDYSITGLTMSGNSRIIIDPSVNTATNFYLEGNVSTLASAPAVNIANTADINMTGITQSTAAGITNQIGTTGFNLSGNTGPNGHGNVNSGIQTAINSQTNIVETAGSAGYFNLYYNGPGSGPSAGSPSNPPSTTFALNGRERMTIFAPNANILVGRGSGYSRPSEYFGSVVGNWVTVTGPRTATPSQFTAMHYDIKLKPGGGAFVNPNQNLSVWGNPVNGNWRVNGGYKAVTWQEAKSPSTDPATWNNSTMWQ
jgi:hypothetical protein